MTGPQMSYLKTLSREAGEEFDENLTKAEASKRSMNSKRKPDAEHDAVTSQSIRRPPTPSRH